LETSVPVGTDQDNLSFLAGVLVGIGDKYWTFLVLRMTPQGCRKSQVAANLTLLFLHSQLSAPFPLFEAESLHWVI